MDDLGNDLVMSFFFYFLLALFLVLSNRIFGHVTYDFSVLNPLTPKLIKKKKKKKGYISRT